MVADDDCELGEGEEGGGRVGEVGWGLDLRMVRYWLIEK